MVKKDNKNTQKVNTAQQVKEEAKPIAKKKSKEIVIEKSPKTSRKNCDSLNKNNQTSQGSKIKDNKQTKPSVKAEHKHKAPLKENRNSNNINDEDIVETEVKNSVTEATPSMDVDLVDLYSQKLNEVEKSLKIKKSQINLAVEALKKIVDDRFKNNLDILARKEDEFIYLNLVFNKLPVRYSIRPTPIDIPHEVYDKSLNTRVCLIVKDPRSDFKDLNIQFPFHFKVFDLEKLRLRYSRFNERRGLLKDFDLFLCDSKVYKVLKRFLGKPFYDHKKYPVPIDLDYSYPDKIKDDVINQVTGNVVFYMTHGPNYNVKVARATMSTDQITSNIINVSAKMIAHIMKWGVSFKE